MKQFCKCFWGELKKPSLASTHKAFLNLELSSLQKSALIELLQKRDRNERHIKNCRLLSFLNTVIKVISKVLLTRLKNVLSSLISSIQTTYFKNRFTIKSERVISDILEMKSTFYWLDLNNVKR